MRLFSTRVTGTLGRNLAFTATALSACLFAGSAMGQEEAVVVMPEAEVGPATYYPYNGPAQRPETPSGKPLRAFSSKSRYVKDDQVVYQGDTPSRGSVHWMNRLVNPSRGEPTGDKLEWSNPFYPPHTPDATAERIGGSRPEEGLAAAAADPNAPNRDEPLIGSLMGIRVVPRTLDVEKDGITNLQGIMNEGVVLPPKVEASLAKYLGQPLSLATLDQLVRDAIVAYRSSDLPVVDVLVPEQEISTGVLQLVVIEGRVGNVKVEGAEYTDPQYLKDQIRLSRGEVVKESVLLRDISWINRHPFRRVNLIYSPGADYGTTDLILQTQDTRPISFYVGYENSGNELLNEDRFIAGVNLSGPLFLSPENTLSYQYTTDMEFDRVQGHSGVWTSYLPWRHFVTFLGAYVTSEADVFVDGEKLETGGESEQFSVRYAIPLAGPRWWSHEIELGGDFKSSNSNLDFGELEVFDTTTEVFQFSLGYNVTQRDQFGATRIDSEVVWSPGGITSDNSDEVFETQRAGATADYVYARAALERSVNLPADWQLIGRVEGQISTNNLLASETLGAGGYDTVRGYEMRIVRGDQGGLASVEVRTPTMSPANWIGYANMRDGMQLLAFYDYGYLENVDPLEDEPDSISLGSFGVGLRYQFEENFSLRMDYGWQIHEDGFNDGETGRFHAGARLSF